MGLAITNIGEGGKRVGDGMAPAADFVSVQNAYAKNWTAAQPLLKQMEKVAQLVPPSTIEVLTRYSAAMQPLLKQMEKMARSIPLSARNGFGGHLAAMQPLCGRMDELVWSGTPATRKMTEVAGQPIGEKNDHKTREQGFVIAIITVIADIADIVAILDFERIYEGIVFVWELLKAYVSPK